MKKFTKLWQLMMILLLTSSVAFAQVSISTADKGANNLNEFQKKELIQKGLATEQEIQAGELSKEAMGYLEKSKEALAEKTGSIVKDNMVTLKEPSYPGEGDACPGSPVWGLPATGFTSAATSDVEPGYRVYQQFFGSYVIDSLHWWGLRYYHDGTAWSACSEDPKNFEVIFYSDNSGVPGTAVATFNATLYGVNSGIPFAADTLYEYTLVLSSQVTLTNGWISVQENPTGDPNCWFLWCNSGTAGPPALQEDVANGTFSDPGYSFSLCLYGAFELTDDLITTDITSPNSGFLGSAETVTMEIFNNGSNAQTNFPVSMTFDGTTYNENYVGTLNPGEYTTYSFTQTIDCSTQGQTYSVDACTELAADQAPSNDCYTHSFASFAPFDCDWMVIGRDDYGDGWNGGYIEIYQDGILTFTFNGPSGAGPDTAYFGIWEGNSMDIVYTEGGWSYENEYEIWSNFGTKEFEDGIGGVTPTGTTTAIPLSCFPPACPDPDTLSTTNIQQTTAKANWTWGGSESQWNLEYGPTGFALGTGTQITGITVTPPPFGSGMPEQVITGLTALTTYDWYVQADCGSGTTSNWVGPITFTTLYPFASYSVPFSSSFESGFDTLANAAGNTTDWVLIDSMSVSPTHSAYNQYGTNNTNILFVTGTVDLSAKVDARLSFDQIAKTEGNWDHSYVEISIDGGSTFFPLPDTLYIGNGVYEAPTSNNPEGPCFDEDSYALWGTGSEIPDNTWWQHEVFSLAPYNTYTNVTFRFRLVSDGSVQRAGWFIDNVVVDEMPACPDPGALGTTFVTPTTAGLVWNEIGSATQWDIEYGATPFTPTGTPSYSTTNNPDTLTGLTPGTEYDYYVRSDCGSGTTSNWVGPYTFTTASVSTLPYDFGFEVNTKGVWLDDQTTDLAWTLNSGGTPSSATGPSAAYEGDWYVYTETSGPSQGATYGMITYFDFSANAAVSFNFAYSMYGATIGELELQVSSDNGATYDSVWGMAGDQGTDWHLASVDMSAYAGSTVLVRFLGTRGSSYTGDIAVDDFHVFEPLAHDVATVSIDMNGFYKGGSVVTPMATVINNGLNTETFDVQMDISGGYTSTATVTALAPGASAQVTFADWTPADGDYTIDVCTQLGTDMDNTNDCITGQPVFVRTFDKKVYGFKGGYAGTVPTGPLTFNLGDPTIVTSIADQSGSQVPYSGTWANSFWYACTSTAFDLITFDPGTGLRDTIGNTGLADNLGGMAYDVAAGVLYGIDGTNLYTIDMATGAATVATAISTKVGGELPINLACSPAGDLYTCTLADTLYMIDKTTGAETNIGYIGYNLNYAQDMEFDYETGDLFIAAYGGGGDGNLRWVDLTTGMSYFIDYIEGPAGSGIELTAFAIPYGYDVAGALTYANTANTPLDHSTARLIAGSMERTMETDCNGIYLFDGIADGTYELNGACTKPRGGTDILDVIRTKQYLGGGYAFTPLQYAAADVNNNSSVDILDAIFMQQLLGGTLNPGWTAPDWVFETQSITVSGGDVIQGVQALCSGDPNGSYVPPMDCPDPTNLGATSITTSSADLTWTSNSGNSNIEWGPMGFTPGTGTMVIGVTSPYSLTGLTASTAYDFYVQDICCGGAGLSNWVGPFTFATSSVYCAAGPTSTADSNVEQVDITGEGGTAISHTGCPGVAGVENLMPYESVDLKIGNTYTLYVTFGTCGGSYAGYGEVWIDWNNDGVFDPATESVGQSNGTPGTAPWDAPVAFTITVPAGATVGATGMRVMQHEGSSQTFPLDPCATYSWGSVMDFTVNVTP